MKKDTHKTVVIFRKFTDGDIIALFPYEYYNERLYGTDAVMSYMHIGQHGRADYSGVIADTKAATPKEHRALRQELESLGYNLDVKLKKGNRR